MRQIVRIVVMVVGLAAAFSAGRWTHAQTPQALQGPQIVPPPPLLRPTPQGPIVLAGSDIGFRVERQKGDVPVGRLVVRVDGRWIEPEFAMRAQQLTVR